MATPHDSDSLIEPGVNLDSAPWGAGRWAIVVLAMVLIAAVGLAFILSAARQAAPASAGGVNIAPPSIPDVKPPAPPVRPPTAGLSVDGGGGWD